MGFGCVGCQPYLGAHARSSRRMREDPQAQHTCVDMSYRANTMCFELCGVSLLRDNRGKFSMIWKLFVRRAIEE